MHLQAAITEEVGGFVAQCLEVDIASQGSTPEEALESLKEALELFFDDEPAKRVTPAQIHTLKIAVP
jgi:predicted RNase H-like HicB family nuclease